ncbi:MAG: hypothetical protein HY785_17960 [Oscillatoriophycideae cyanobacterium NC_groundwater_1537_Pr4_S-0.65um_50_18]|nr:hypothetical protein [Oscillatoriophycideae cyanobacterium NC_groundwater_1537_Pr4_S-0.65um_50_18]
MDTTLDSFDAIGIGSIAPLTPSEWGATIAMFGFMIVVVYLAGRWDKRLRE